MQVQEAMECGFWRCGGWKQRQEWCGLTFGGGRHKSAKKQRRPPPHPAPPGRGEAIAGLASLEAFWQTATYGPLVAQRALHTLRTTSRTFLAKDSSPHELPSAITAVNLWQGEAGLLDLAQSILQIPHIEICRYIAYH